MGYTIYTTTQITPATVTVTGVNGQAKQITNPAYPSTPNPIKYTPPTYDRFSSDANLRKVLLTDAAGTATNEQILAAFPLIFDDQVAALLKAAQDHSNNYISDVGFAILANGITLALTKAMAVSTWSNNLWTLYYQRKAAINLDTATSNDFSSIGAIPHSVPELLAELTPYLGIGAVLTNDPRLSGVGSLTTVAFSVEFLSEDTFVIVTVANAAITATSKMVVVLEGEEAAILGLQGYPISTATGSCDLGISAPNGATGTYSGHIVII